MDRDEMTDRECWAMLAAIWGATGLMAAAWFLLSDDGAWGAVGTVMCAVLMSVYPMVRLDINSWEK